MTGRWSACGVLVLATAVALANCGGNSKSAKSAPGASDACGTSTAELTYGCGPAPDASVKYQPDVVVVRGGARAIKSAGSNGLVWTIDRNAAGASRLRVGSVMFVTSRAVGRVVDIKDYDDDRVVTLLPVDLTDVVTDATFNIDQDIDFSKMTYQAVPDLPGSVSEATTAQTKAASVRTPTNQLMSAPYIPPLPPPTPIPKEVKVGKFSAKPYGSSTKLGLKVEYKGKTHGLKLTLDLALLVDNPHIQTGEAVVNGKVVKSGFLVQGVKGLQISISGGAEHGSFDNEKVSLEIPVEVNVPIPPIYTAGIPLNFKVTYSFTVETAFSGNNSTLFATGKYGLDGPLGILDGVATSPTFSVEQSIIDSIGGLPIGVSGIVFGMTMKLLAGVGTAAASAGPFGTFTATVGLTNGSALGAALARCHGATLIIKVGGGVGLDIPAPVAKAINALIPMPAGMELSSESVEISKEVVHRSQVVPDVALCRDS